MVDEDERQRLAVWRALDDRMSAVGSFAAGIAHEINNPLASVMMNLEVMAAELKTEGQGVSAARASEMVEIVSEAREGTDRIRTIVSGLQAFSRTESERRVPVDVRAVLDLSVNLALNEIKHRGRLVREYSDVPLVEAVEARLGHAFLSLLLNAAHALPEGQTHRNEIRLTVAPASSGTEVLIQVRDTGRGIPRHLFERIFDPFFTGNADGKAAGLGLSICRGVVTALGGRVWVASEVGEGSTFSVILPALDADMRPLSTLPPADATPADGRPVVLVVDDDVLLAKTVGRSLSRDHDVTVVTSGAQAIALLGEGRRYDLILCDLMMPSMTGMDLYGEIARLVPEQLAQIVFVTGGAFSAWAREFLESVPNVQLDKPFTVQSVRDLARTLARGRSQI